MDANVKPTMKVSLDDGETWQDASQVVRVKYDNVPVVVDGQDGHGMLHITLGPESMILDTFGTRADPLDTVLGVVQFDLDEMVDLSTMTIKIDTSAE